MPTLVMLWAAAAEARALVMLLLGVQREGECARWHVAGAARVGARKNAGLGVRGEGR